MQYTIAEMAREFDITTRTIRFYEDKGLLTPERCGSRRVFHERDRVRLKLVLRGKRLGLSLDEICEIIDLYDPSGSNDQRQLLLLCRRIQEHREALLHKLRDIQETLSLMNEVEAGCLGQLEGLRTDRTPKTLN